METRQKTAGIPPFGLRMQPELKSRLEKEAAGRGRSLNAEIVARLENSFAAAAAVPATAGALLAEWRSCMEMSAERAATLTRLLAKPDNAMTQEDVDAAENIFRQLEILTRSLQQIESQPNFPEVFRESRERLAKQLATIRMRDLRMGSPELSKLVDYVYEEKAISG